MQRILASAAQIYCIAVTPRQMISQQGLTCGQIALENKHCLEMLFILFIASLAAGDSSLTH